MKLTVLYVFHALDRLWQPEAFCFRADRERVCVRECVHPNYIQLYSPIYMVAEIRKTTDKKKERNLAIAPMTSIP